MTGGPSIGVLVETSADPVIEIRCRAVLTAQLGPADRLLTTEDAVRLEELGVDAVAVLAGGAVPGPHWVGALRGCFNDPSVGAATGPVLRFTDARSTNVLVANRLGGALTGKGAWSDVPPVTHSTDWRICHLPPQQYAVRSQLVGGLTPGELATITGRAAILAACARTGLAVIRDSSLQTEVHAPASANGHVRVQLAHDEGYLRMCAALQGSGRGAHTLRDVVRWLLIGSARSPGLLVSLPLMVVSSGLRRRLARAAATGRFEAVRGKRALSRTQVDTD